MIFLETARGIDLKGPFKALLKLGVYFGITGFIFFSFHSFLSGQEKLIAIKGSKIYTASEKGIIEKGIILIRNDRIVEIGPQIVIPSEAKVFDFKDKFIMPGIVSSDSSLGIFKQPSRGERAFPMRLPESPGKNLAYYPVLYSIYPEHPDYQLALSNGFTTLALSPPPEGISGLGAVIKPYGERLEDILVKDKASLKITVYVNTPFWKMMKRSLEEAQTKLDEQKKKKEEEKTKEQKKREGNNEEREEAPIGESTKVFMEVLEGKIPIVAECKNPDAVSHILALVSDYPKIKLIIRGGPDTYKAGPLLKEKGIPIILEPRIETKTSFYAPYPERTNYVLKCQGLGLKIALQAPGNVEEQIELFHYLNMLYQLGVKKDVLLRGVTIIPAQLLGVNHLVGSLEKGKRADMIVLKNDPLENIPVIEKVILEGKFVQ